MLYAHKIAYYRKEDWQYFLEIIDDRDKVDDTWEEWFLSFSKLKSALESEGLVVIPITINLKRLKRYCTKKNIKNIGATRAKYVLLK